MAEEGLPGELRALGRALEIPPSGGRPADGGHPADGGPGAHGVPGTDGVPPEGGETLVERVIARIVGLPVPVADDRIREEQWWGPLPGLEAGQGPGGGVSRSADREPGRRPSARPPRS
ncbi:hypothetical protein [Streptomyces hygroscopicus]|uniref:hypothetical protein n=1 Tax=Streptomyces hygroscopicus TaxID=1912 RepID=UPI000767BACA|nr:MULTISPECIES: hypothetical protein [Streptomyces]